MREQVAAISQEPLPNHQEIEHSLLMTSTELADYLGISIEQHDSIGPESDNNLELPFMTIENKYITQSQQLMFGYLVR